MSKYYEDEQYEKYLINKEYKKQIDQRGALLDLKDDPFKSKNYNNNKPEVEFKKNPLYKNVNFSEMSFIGFSPTGIKKKITKRIKKITEKKDTGKKGDACLMVTCNDKVCFC
tara:strand:- start:86 stop:421 length:336 start_codon:yes stop_codon:yes gene_type:complete